MDGSQCKDRCKWYHAKKGNTKARFYQKNKDYSNLSHSIY